ncbi:MAG: TM1802 family CRISPR-associated protein, partial [Promethearchaeota archaeon]
MSSAYLFGTLIGDKEKRSYLEFFTENIRLGKDGKGKILTINFDLKKSTFNIDTYNVSKNDSEKLAKKYLWIGNTPDTTNRYLTTSNISRYISGGITKNPLFVLKKSLERENKYEKLKSYLEEITSKFFPSKLNYCLNIKLCEKYDNFIEILFSIIKDYNKAPINKEKENLFKKINKLVNFIGKKEEKLKWIESIKSKEDIDRGITEIIKNKDTKPKIFDELFININNLTFKELALASIKINGRLISEIEEYVDYLYEEKSSRKSDGKTSIEKYCDLCHQYKEVSSEILKKAWIKFFITDKKIFSAGLTKKFETNFSICNDCFIKLSIGEQYILRYFSKRWANKRILFIPDLYTEKTLDYKKITNALSDINDYIYKYNIIE